jgi:hypothetical protein
LEAWGEIDKMIVVPFTSQMWWLQLGSNWEAVEIRYQDSHHKKLGISIPN